MQPAPDPHTDPADPHQVDGGETAVATDAGARPRMAQSVLRGVLRLFVAAGWLVPIGAIVGGHGLPDWHLEQLLLGAGLVAIALYSDRLGMEFRFGGREVLVTPDTVAWVCAAVFLPVPLAMLLGAATMSTLFAREDDEGAEDDEAPARTLGSLLRRARIQAIDTGVLMAAIGASGWVVHALLPHPDALLAIAAAVLAAVAFTLAASAGGLLYVSVEAPEAVREVFDDMRVVGGFDVGLATIACALVAPFHAASLPFHSAPLLVFAAIAAYQVLTHATLMMLKSEQTHRAQSTYLRDTFSRYLPASVVDQLGDDQAAVELGGGQHDITVMFVDVRNFTSWSESRSPADIVSRLNQLMTLLTQCVFDTEGTLDKFTGDGLMAFWGAPLEQPDHADRAVAAALDMLERIETFNADRPANEIELRIGVGIHSGPAIVGNVGHVDRLDYTAIGDTVNVSARLEAQTKESRCDAIVSGDSCNRLQRAAELGPLEHLGEIAVKGRTEPVSCFVLKRSLPVLAPVDVPRDIAA